MQAPTYSNGKAIGDQFASLKCSLFSPNEVTFCVDDEDEDEQQRKCDDNSETESIISSTVTTISKKKPVIPDGGFGWVVVMSSFFVSLIADGISFSFGLIYTELLHNFGSSATKLAWVGSFFLAVPLMSGPVLSNLVDKYGCRKMTMLGGVISCTGFVLAAFSDTIELLYLTFGVLAGIGLGFGYVTAVVSIAFWFDKRRTFATGIGASGTGLGTFLFAPLTQYLINTFGWRGATLVLAGFLLNFCVCGALMRDPDWLIEENAIESRSESLQTFSPQASNLCLDEIKKLIETGLPKEDILDTLVTNVNTEANQKIPNELETIKSKKFVSEMLLPTFLKGSNENGFGRPASRRSLKQHLLSRENMPDESDRKSDKNCALASTESLETWEKIPSNETVDLISLSNAASIVTSSVKSLDDSYFLNTNNINHASRFSLDETLMLKPLEKLKKDLDRSVRGVSLDVVRENQIFNPNSEAVVEVPEMNLIKKLPKKRHRTAPPTGFKNKPSLKYPNYFRNMRVHRNSIQYKGVMLNGNKNRLKASSCPNIYRNASIIAEEEETWFEQFADLMKSMFNLSLFLDFKFAMMSISTFLLFVFFIFPYFYLPEFMLKYGFQEEDSANLISVIGIFNTIGMIVLGWAGDQKNANVTRMYGHCLVGCGTSVLLIPLFIKNYIMLIVLCTLFGLTFASTFSFTPIILVRLVNLDDFTCAYGLVLLVQGLGNLVGPPLAGIIYDMTNRWDDTFYLAGVFIIISGFFAWAVGQLDEPEEDDD